MPLQKGHYAAVNPAWLLNGSPSSFRAQPFSREAITNDEAAALTTQVMTHVAVPVQAGDIISNITFVSGATAAGTPTNWWFALYKADGTLIAQTADQTTAAWAADTQKTVALGNGAPYMPTADGIVYAAIMVKATTVPSLLCKTFPRAAIAAADAAFTGQKRLAGTSDSALTTTAPGPMGTPTAVAKAPYCVLS